MKVTPSTTLPRQKRLEGFRGWWETLLTKISRGWYVKSLSPIALFPITVQDFENANSIFGPDLANLRGEIIRTKPEHAHIEYVQISWGFVELHKYVMLVADVIFVGGLPFLVTSLQGISLECLELGTAKRLIDTLERVIRIYKKVGFIVENALIYMEFKKLRDMLPNKILNTTAA